MTIRLMTFRSKHVLTGLFVALTCFSGLIGQNLTFITADWSDSFREWTLLDEEENEMGEINLTWGMGDNWTSWTVSSDDLRMEMKRKWRDDPNIWEANVDGNWIEARTTFPDRLDSWRIKYQDKQYILQQALAGRWEIRNSERGIWEIENYYVGDPRDWVIIKDRLDWPLELETFMSMLVIAHMTPQE